MKPVWLIGLLMLALVGMGAAWWLWPPPLPFEPDFLSLETAELRLWTSADQAEVVDDPQAGALAVIGSEMSLWIESPRELGPVLFQVRGRLRRVAVRSAGKTEEFEPPSAESETPFFFLEWQPENPRQSPERPGFFYRLALSLSPLPSGPSLADDEATTIALIGSRAYLDRNLHGVEWLGCGTPKEVLAGEAFQVLARMRNVSDHTWPHQGHDRIRLATRWHESRTEAGPRTDLGATIEVGDEAARWATVQAPDRPGRHILDMDLFHEPIAWFSSKGAPICQAEILVR